MADLCDLTCEACRADAPKVSAGEQEILLKDIDGWAINTDPCDMLVKKYNFESYDEAVSFTNAIAEMAEAEGHHPKIIFCLLYTSPSPRDRSLSRMPSSA